MWEDPVPELCFQTPAAQCSGHRHHCEHAAVPRDPRVQIRQRGEGDAGSWLGVDRNKVWEPSCRYSSAWSGLGEVQGITFPPRMCFVVFKPITFYGECLSGRFLYLLEKYSLRGFRDAMEGHTPKASCLCQVKFRAIAKSGIC